MHGRKGTHPYAHVLPLGTPALLQGRVTYTPLADYRGCEFLQVSGVARIGVQETRNVLEIPRSRLERWFDPRVAAGFDLADEQAFPIACGP